MFISKLGTHYIILKLISLTQYNNQRKPASLFLDIFKTILSFYEKNEQTKLA